MTSNRAKSGEAVKRTREARGMTQLELARRTGISRQALGAIESGAYQPGVTAAIAIARALGETVENLFGLEAGDPSRRVRAELLGADKAAPPHRVALARVGGRVVAIAQPAVRVALTPAAGVVELAGKGRTEIETTRTDEEIDATLLIAGCDPAAAILSEWLARHRAPFAAVVLPCSSTRALGAVLEGRAHAAGLHLRDPRSGEYNLAAMRRALGARRAAVVTFARWELGLAIAPGRVRSIRGVADLARPGVRIVNREQGAGARAALDEALAEAGIAGESVDGYGFEVGGHLEVAAAIAAGQADAGFTIRLAAEAFGLAFTSIREERYDFVIPEAELKAPPVRAMLEALNSRRFAREISQLCHYDTSEMGRIIAPAEAAGLAQH
jgi:putative molybdopterin biosynthesis protein